MKKIQSVVTAILFLVVLFGIGMATLLLPDRTFSESENRTLSDAPTLSISALLDKSFMQNAETYVTDQIAGREYWVSSKYQAELLTGKDEIGGVYITDDRMILKQTEVDEATVSASIAAINTLAAGTEVPVYLLLAPTAAAIYADTLPDYAPNLNQQMLIASVGEQLNDGITMINTYNVLHSMRDEYIYYRTDHHWTSYGAYIAYKSAIKALGFSAISYDKYNIEHVSNSFRGTLYSRCLIDSMEPDMVDLYLCENGAQVTDVAIFDGLTETHYDSLYFRDYLDTRDQYGIFLNANNAMVTIRTDVKNDKRLLVIKDSYANSLIPFLTQHYSEIVVLDLRYVRGRYQELVEVSEFSQVLLLYNTSNFTSDRNLRLLGIA